MIHLDKNCSNYFITSESVSAGHPDKIADQISDVVLDYCISINPFAHAAIETLITKNKVIIAGEVYGVDFDKSKIEFLVRETIKDIGYDKKGFNWKSVDIDILIHEQSPDIIMGINIGKNQGAGDQGIMYGYAINETKSLIPAPIFYAHLILKNIMKAVKEHKIIELGPDAKTQITLLYENNKPVKVSHLVLSIQHFEGLSNKQIKEIVYPYVLSSLPQGWMCSNEDFLVNPTGRFVIGGPVSDCGLTGRKIMIDTYGGHIPHGGGAFSGKDPSKVDRSAAYMARYIAKNIVSSGLAKECLVQLSYAIGIADPLSFDINTFNKNFNNEKVKKIIQENIDLSIYGICNYLMLCRPIYRSTSCYGHFGRNPTSYGNFSWEKEDLSLILCKEFQLYNYRENCQ
ncbi:methionine adenosyltransferase [Neoehrlichia mikurensis]|uniref:Methionine adenosyltransferase n=1 Tax=Neoehrlichia mikurensis TaxID=89586 RepID=A0A9Q9BVX0_9RICK|nr:methionine adenosyltransferase [Neoehrlichia mikurensis]QXK92329.1 methionine adenosyltransferase [Neoehrlichia mikurensis]QXK92783.1 methionine adenosyltransferase [Neoehrlichia mikurensis]QXK94024.1 methionine adenosyltransferase [Neoehrlichia mikurensis]UTO55811.1 methionine adenosyltransferase [Neoehrlichia mikurensis]UTO56726.1 methionine adenosyltransferase [Neoehrlichia mikurensis]